MKLNRIAAVTALGIMAAAGTAQAAEMVVGFAQVGSESGWRAAETKTAKLRAHQDKVNLRISDAQQKQENEIKAIRSFVAQGVDGILLAPVVATGWDSVLREARDAKVPVFLLDRQIDTSDPTLYTAAVTSDTVLEGHMIGDHLAKLTNNKCRIVELQGTVGSSPAINRKKGFEEAIAAHPDMKIVRSQSGDFTRSGGKTVMESFIKAEDGGKNICAVFAHNDDMGIGAIQAIKEAGLKPGKDILVVSIDGVPDMFKAMANGEANGTVELSPDMAGPALKALIALKSNGTEPQKWIKTPSTLYTPATAAAEYKRRAPLY
ncbi:galactofuranose ABC transporter, galactofuranose-binding protein YtfQ [Lichenicoccus roseus]|uniref:ABC transporter substrate-binding protein n=1 Tax=Lichenicoccus roseus TaxID=2683649 RepID=A0A5R9J202_9PROT|nr:galactofuranose ABC transporter, galactofuranose-binding protein YtfQ [Lichenicoccus roseus]TLU71670.1 ABC transporter substrate-binding protein [Lichenicoccus roseus]